MGRQPPSKEHPFRRCDNPVSMPLSRYAVALLAEGPVYPGYAPPMGRLPGSNAVYATLWRLPRMGQCVCRNNWIAATPKFLCTVTSACAKCTDFYTGVRHVNGARLGLAKNKSASLMRSIVAGAGLEPTTFGL